MPNANELRALAESAAPAHQRIDLIERRIRIEAAAGRFGHAFLRTHFRRDDFGQLIQDGCTLRETEEHYIITW